MSSAEENIIIAPPHLFTKDKDLVDLKTFISIVLETISTRNLRQTPLVYALERIRTSKQNENFEGGKDFVCAEFGCYTGGTLGQIVEYLSSSSSSHTKIYGFDSFEGLPENWYNGKGKGWFNLNSKEISVSGAVIIKGWFEDTVPGFFRDALSVGSSVLGLVHIDSDLYSSAKVVLNELGRFLHESAQFPEFENHEIKALYEFLRETDDFIQCELIGSDQRETGGKPRFYRKNEPCDMRVLFQLLPRAQ